MKVGGNESATKYFQSHGGSALLASKDAKTRYTSPTATKYKDELKRRAAADARELVHINIIFKRLDQVLTSYRFPEEVIITDILSPTFPDGTSTPSGDPGDDFFSSWDKPAIKRPSNPPSRTQTPAISRTASPFLNAAPTGVARSKSPGGTESESAPAAPPAASRTTSSSALRKTATTGGPRKGVLGAKKTQKLGAKKVLGADAIDFEAAEKKAKEEAERIEKLGYDPDAEEPPTTSTPVDQPKIAAPTPVSPPKTGGFGATAAKGHQRSPSEMERLGMGMGRLGFGQVGGSKPAPKKMGFGAVGAPKAVEESMSIASTSCFHKDINGI